MWTRLALSAGRRSSNCFRVMTVPEPIVWATVQDVEDWLGLPDTRTPLERADDAHRVALALESATSWVQARVKPASEYPPGYLASRPELKQAVIMLAARWYSRRESIYGLDAIAIGGEGGPVLTTDPDIQRLIQDYRRSSFGGYPLPEQRLGDSS